jgi:hypothetical protein
MVFRYAVPLLVLGFLLSLLLKNTPLRATSASAERDAMLTPPTDEDTAVPVRATAPDAAPDGSRRDGAPMPVLDPVVVMD